MRIWIQECKINPRDNSQYTKKVSWSGREFRNSLSNCEFLRKGSNTWIIFIVRMTSGEENSPLGPHLHFHLFHLVGQANPKNQGRKKNDC